MKYISLGRSCSISYNIKKYINNDIPTQFFDWSRSDFKCILIVLNLRMIDTLFNIENLIIDKELYKPNDISITLKNFVADKLTLLYHHDIPYGEYNKEEMEEKLLEFINKYKRRHNRLIELIKSDKEICFLYDDSIEPNVNYDDVELFDSILKDINKNIQYKLVFFVQENQDTYIYCKYEKYIKINLKHFIINEHTDWTKDHIDWVKIFELIKNIV